jgi:hypothetical protein
MAVLSPNITLRVHPFWLSSANGKPLDRLSKLATNGLLGKQYLYPKMVTLPAALKYLAVCIRPLSHSGNCAEISGV